MRRISSGNSAWMVRVGAGVLAIHAWGAPPALAQSAGATAGDGAPSEAARRQALSPFRMILQNADAPRRAAAPAPAPVPRRQAPAPEPATAAAPAAAAPAPSAAPVQAASPVEAPKAEQVTALQPSAAASKAPPAPPPPIELIPVEQEPPILSAILRREQPRGKVTVAFSVKPDGSTSDVQVVSSSDRRLNSASVHAVAGWRFKPIREAQPVEVELVFGEE